MPISATLGVSLVCRRDEKGAGCEEPHRPASCSAEHPARHPAQLPPLSLTQTEAQFAVAAWSAGMHVSILFEFRPNYTSAFFQC